LKARFGTDGVRGVANAELTPELVLRLGRAIARELAPETILLGRDTRISGPMLCSALAAGLAGEGVGVVDVGVVPTPGLAWLSAERGMPAAMVSASHNPFADNGVKLFAAGGLKLPERAERAIEKEMERPAEPARAVVGAGVGAVGSDTAAVEAYAEHVVSCLEGRRLDGMHVVLDCAFGSASGVAPAVIARLGARTEVLFAEPDGCNINLACGSTHPEALQAKVLECGAQVGLAFDGDADRLIAVDEKGELVDGDHLMSLFAADLKERGLLSGGSVVVSVMTNLGFHRAMRRLGVRVLQTPVGDRYVLEELERNALVLGGEQSGHIVFRHLATTGDGLLTAALLLDLLERRGGNLSELAAGAMTRVPQELLSVTVADPSGLESAKRVWDEVAAAEAELGSEGRVLLRASGTEPKVRVMVEAASSEKAASTASRLGAVVARELA
jgi:phosphoglucosamine mutase